MVNVYQRVTAAEEAERLAAEEAERLAAEEEARRAEEKPINFNGPVPRSTSSSIFN